MYPGRLGYQAFGAVPQNPMAPTISPNLKRLEKKFPHLGFTVNTRGLAAYVVQIAANKSLFADPSGRTQSNWFESPVMKAEPDESSYYLVSPAVLQALGKASELFYNVIGYSSLDRKDPRPAMSDRELAASAPSVAVAADFNSSSLAFVLNVPLADLVRVEPRGSVAYEADGTLDAAADALEGEDGLDVSPMNTGVDYAYGDSASFGGDGSEEEEEESGVLEASYASDDDGYSDGYEEQAAALESDDGDSGDYESYASADGAEEPEEAEASEAEPYEAEASEAESYDAEAYEAEASEAGAPEMLEDEDYHAAYDETPASGAEAYAESYSEADSTAHSDDYADGYDDDNRERESMAAEESSEDGESYGESYEDATGEEPMDSGYAFAAAAPALAPVKPRQPFTIADKKNIIEAIAAFESGSEAYAAVNRDGEFAGKFPGHPATGKYHAGLSYGIVQFTQDSGSLGKVLDKMREKDPPEFGRIFGPQAGELLRVTNLQGPPSRKSPGGRSVRVQPIGGADLWSDTWVARFKAAGAHKPFQAAQNEMAAKLYLDPALEFASRLGLRTDRALAMVFDRAVQLGVTGAKRWIIAVAGPVTTDALRQQALAAVGYNDLISFQKAVKGLPPNGVFTPDTHAALIAGLSAKGSSPVPIPHREEILDGMVRWSANGNWGHRVKKLRESAKFKDVEFDI